MAKNPFGKAGERGRNENNGAFTLFGPGGTKVTVKLGQNPAPK